MRRFFVALSHAPLGPKIVSDAFWSGAAAGLKLISEQPGFLFMVENIEGYVLEQEALSGGLIGDLYFRHGPGMPFNGSASDQDRLTAICRNGKLVDRCWGSFLLLRKPDDGRAIEAHHSPFSSLPVYYVHAHDVLFLASDALLLARSTEERAGIDWQSLAMQLAVDDLPTRSTCVTDVRELRGGETLEWPQGTTPMARFNWNPWEHASQDRWLIDQEAALELLEREITRCASARMIGSTASLLDLSGGLDSSILAAVAARSKAEVCAVNVFAQSTEGDERVFARSVAEHLHMTLAEAEPRAELVDVRLCATPYLPRPHARSFVQEIDRLTVAAAPGATAFINGGGGDAVLCHLQSSGPAVDLWRSQRNIRSLWGVITDLSEAAQVSFWVGLRKAVAKSLRSHRQVRLTPDLTFLSREVSRDVSKDELPWPAPPHDAFPGKLEHVRGIYSSCFNMHGFGRSGSLKAVFPMLSQPLVETCLRIPTWMWLGNGHDRYLARRIAAKWLPDQVAWRRSKGGLGRLQRDIYRLNRDTLRDMLLGGVLQGAGLIDRSAVEAQLAPSSDLTSRQFPRLLRLADFEAWAQHWT